ncbi:hypothetical protein NM688_g7813 [Phlebia brevispora]|uniref:Uncharacterized protein n=1 Tax=Phlebia brevispora TaxID=194682 RepID=A0ACC1S0V0_9APHY|nr:hypothetical protein NM688_g7813 [Phlebia brevispora]
MSSLPPLPSSQRKCSAGHCSKVLPDNYSYKKCESCREIDRIYQAGRRRAAKVLDKNPEGLRRSLRNSPAPDAAAGDSTADAGTRRRECSPIAPQPLSDRSGSGDMENKKTHDDIHTLMARLREMVTSAADNIHFTGECFVPADPLVSYKERVELTVKEIWDVTGFRWTVHDHPKMQIGHKTRLWCSQDQARKKASKTSEKPDAKHRDTLGMARYPCKSSLVITCKPAALRVKPDHVLVSISLQHHASADHRPYLDVALPPEANEIIRRQIEWSKPNEILREVQAKFPQVSAAQVHNAWAKMSEVLWKRDSEQLPSAKVLLEELKNDVDVFDIKAPEGVEQLCWGMKLIAEPLRGQTVEVGLDATYDTNSKHLELYSIMAEHDNAGFPLSYCLLSTATSMDIHKRRNALKAWADHVREKYDVNPTFIHLDKDMGEIGMARDVWIAKIQLCWWHLRRAVRTRLAKNKLSTTPYNPYRAHDEFPFIDIAFRPPDQGDPCEYEGGLDTIAPAAVPERPERKSVNALFIRLPGSYIPNSPNIATEAAEAPPSLPESRQLGIRVDAEQGISERASHTVADGTTNTALTIRVPCIAERTIVETRVFCAEEYRESIVDMMERHLCAHPLIPGYSHPSPEGIREWAVNEMYMFCVDHDLREVWAYLWENWYRSGRWELWARAPHPQIPRLKTTMLLESHWRRIKHDFLHHFRLPRLDLLVWVIVKQLARTYYRKLDMRLTDTGRFRELPDWRKAFKREWKRCVGASCTVPFKPKYSPNPHLWVCTCPYFATSRFLVCKHLVRTVHSVKPIFFLQVTRNRTTPFWSHPTLVPLDDDEILALGGVINKPRTSHLVDNPSPEPPNVARRTLFLPLQDNADDSDDDIIDTGTKGTYRERMTVTIALLRDLADGLEYQVRFNDHRLLTTVEREAAGALRLARNIQRKEREANSLRATPRTWEASNVMFYNSRPSSGSQPRGSAGANN